jgi:hypothetical protein
LPPNFVRQTTLTASPGGVKAMLGAVCVNAGGVVTPVIPVDLSTLKVAAGALARSLDARPEPSWEITFRTWPVLPSAYGLRSGWYWNGALVSVARRTPST